MTSNQAASTATDTLRRKSEDASIVSGGRLVAKALRNEGVDTIFTLCGGHIIDIYDGCIDEGASGLSTSATSKLQRMRRMATRARRDDWAAW